MAGKADIVDVVADAVDGSTKRQVGEIFDAIFDAITKSLVAKDRVAISGFGNFSVSHREARQGRNPATGATIQIAATNNVKFKAGKDLKEAVNS